MMISSYKLSILFVFFLLTACQLQSQEREEEPPQKVERLTRKDSTATKDSIPLGLQRLLKAYPNQFEKATANRLIWKDGTEMIYDDGLEDKEFIDLLQNPDLEDQLMAMPYPKGLADQPQPKEDPGRVRYEPFFKKMYGNSKEEVRQNLTEIIWLPKSIGKKLQVTTVNDIHLKLESISNQLDTMPELLKYLQNPGGTFNWRFIAGTKRLSLHSFGMTIDINVQYSDYWRWHVKGEDPNGSRIIEYRNQIPMKIVEIFEAHGFIWGGKWYHYDSMHFEYRPELLVP
jgi:peptidoglycan L-alanyl-D-glutamate endopeptidase CwlK